MNWFRRIRSFLGSFGSVFYCNLELVIRKNWGRIWGFLKGKNKDRLGILMVFYWFGKCYLEVIVWVRFLLDLDFLSNFELLLMLVSDKLFFWIIKLLLGILEFFELRSIFLALFLFDKYLFIDVIIFLIIKNIRKIAIAVLLQIIIIQITSPLLLYFEIENLSVPESELTME